MEHYMPITNDEGLWIPEGWIWHLEGPMVMLWVIVFEEPLQVLSLSLNNAISACD